MHKENLIALRESIRASKTYDQSRASHPCGSPACLAGHAVSLAGCHFTRHSYSDATCINAQGEKVSIWHEAAKFLQLTSQQMKDMFFTFRVIGGYYVNKRIALLMLDYAIEHDVIHWRCWKKEGLS